MNSTAIISLRILQGSLLGFVALIVGIFSVIVTPLAVLLGTTDLKLNEELSGFDLDSGESWSVRVPTHRLRAWLSWLETPDERDGDLPGGLYEPAIRSIYKRYGWRIASIRWLWRNRAYRFRQWLRWFDPITVDYATTFVGSKFLDNGSACPPLTGTAVYVLGTAEQIVAAELYIVWRYGQSGWAFKLRAGVTAQPYVRNEVQDWPKDASKTVWGQPRFSVNPLYKVT